MIFYLKREVKEPALFYHPKEKAHALYTFFGSEKK